MVRSRHRSRVCPFIRILVHELLVVQRAMAAKSMSAARNTPLIGAIPKMFIPILVILPGMIAMALTAQSGTSGFAIPKLARRNA